MGLALKFGGMFPTSVESTLAVFASSVEIPACRFVVPVYDLKENTVNDDISIGEKPEIATAAAGRR